MPFDSQHSTFNRRAFLFGASAAVTGLAASPSSAFSFFRRTQEPVAAETRSLFMVNQRTEEIFHEVYFNGEAYLQESLDRFALFSRDLRNGEYGEMDPHLLDLASDVQKLIGIEEPLILTHGYRSSRNVRGGAANSHHLHGEALDIAHPRLNARDLHRHAAALGRGGLGRYARFVHIDTGPTRRW